MTARRVAILHLTDRRDHAPSYQRLADALNASALAAVRTLGWRGALHASADAPVSASLAVARRADLVVLLGGEDLHPDFYGGDRDYEGRGRHLQRGDEAQLAVVRDAVEHGTPVLGICRGHQVLNVALGGDLIQHLGDTDRHRDNRPGAPETFTRHTVDVRDGLLGDSIRPGERVQSSHHQAVARLGAGLRAAAASDDGVVEAVVHESLPIVGVQWHPEHRGAPENQLGRLLRHLDARAA